MLQQLDNVQRFDWDYQGVAAFQILVDYYRSHQRFTRDLAELYQESPEEITEDVVDQVRGAHTAREK